MTTHHIDVLIVEDEPWLSQQFTRSLESAKYTVRTTTNGLVAMDLIDEQHPRVLVVDMLLTGGTVLPLLHELQSYTDTSSIPVVLCTNLATDLSVKDLQYYGVRRIIDKTTMLPDDIIAAVRYVL
ncbi:MAG: response regulator [Chloroflexi bacterium]|nr:MAG: response regulator [Chloroflexota bacterium]